MSDGRFGDQSNEGKYGDGQELRHEGRERCCAGAEQRCEDDQRDQQPEDWGRYRVRFGWAVGVAVVDGLATAEGRLWSGFRGWLAFAELRF